MEKRRVKLLIISSWEMWKRYSLVLADFVELLRRKSEGYGIVYRSANGGEGKKHILKTRHNNSRVIHKPREISTENKGFST